MDLSIVIPAYREGRKIGRDVEAAGQFLVASTLRGEIIVVDDGSPDNTTEMAERAPIPSTVARRIIRFEANRGKGRAVCAGIQSSRGQYVLFADSGLCVPFACAMSGMDLIRQGVCQIAHGSRKLPQSIIVERQPVHRRLLSRLFRVAARGIVGTPRGLTDTQCGFKIYQGDIARELYGQCRTDGFMFDIEILMRARSRGYHIVEFPIQWTCDPDSRLHPGRTARRILQELLAVRRLLDRQAGSTTSTDSAVFHDGTRR